VNSQIVANIASDENETTDGIICAYSTKEGKYFQ
jgi:hypothetical protein